MEMELKRSRKSSRQCRAEGQSYVGKETSLGRNFGLEREDSMLTMDAVLSVRKDNVSSAHISLAIERGSSNE